MTNRPAIRPLRSHTYMPAQFWWTPYLINTWSGNYERAHDWDYAPTYDRLYGGVQPYRPKHVPIKVTLEAAA